jgi:hypothetical protein
MTSTSFSKKDNDDDDFLNQHLLHAMIFNETKFYKCENYFYPSEQDFEDDDDDEDVVSLSKSSSCDDDRSINSSIRSSTVSSSWEFVVEIARLVTDFRFVQAPPPEPPLPDSEEQNEHHHNVPSCNKKLFNELSASPISSADDLYGMPKRSESNNKKIRRRPSALEVSCLSNWRHKMCDWACSVCQSCEIDENCNLLAVTFNLLDRYLAIKLSDCNELGVSKEDFQLFCMVCLHIAVKMTIPASLNKLSMKAMVEMARGFYSYDDMITTERDILVTLDWHLNPPTVMDYCSIYLHLFPIDGNHIQDFEDYKFLVLRKCRYLAEVALDDIFFIDKESSTVALAVFLLATDASRMTVGDANRRERRRSYFTSISSFLSKIQGIVNISDSQYDAIHRRLQCFVE